jgi:hypothetical protein
MQAYFRPVLALQLIYCSLCIAWNATGLWQISQGVQSIGPTASWSAILILGTLSAVFFLSYRFDKAGINLAASLMVFVLASLAVWGGFSKPPESWPSEFWRYAGIAVHVLGILTFVFVLKAFIRFRKSLRQ